VTYGTDGLTDLNGVGALRAYFDQFWSRALTAYKAAVERQEELS